MKVIDPLLGILLAALINAVPSDAAFHPSRALCDLAEADLAGSGREAPVENIVVRAGMRDDADDREGRYWRNMAQRCRNLAAWHNSEAREALLRLAEEYEERARGVEPPGTTDDNA